MDKKRFVQNVKQIRNVLFKQLRQALKRFTKIVKRMRDFSKRIRKAFKRSCDPFKRTLNGYKQIFLLNGKALVSVFQYWKNTSHKSWLHTKPLYLPCGN